MLAWVLFCCIKHADHILSLSVDKKDLAVVDNNNETHVQGIVQDVLLHCFCLYSSSFSFSGCHSCKSSLNTQLRLVLYQGRCLIEQHPGEMVITALVCITVPPSSALRVCKSGPWAGVFSCWAISSEDLISSAHGHAIL